MVSIYLKYLGGDFFLNVYVSAVAEITAKLLTSVFIARIGLKRTYFVAYSVAAVSSCLLIFLAENSSTTMIAVLVIGCKAGLCMGFCTAYLAIVLVYPTTFVATAMGFCNIIARIASITAPMVAEISDPWPMSILAAMCAAAAILSSFIIVKIVK
jgi:hypothetical protein